MKRVLTALILIPLVLLLVFKAPLWAIALVCCGVALLAMHEYLHIVRQYGVEPFTRLTYVLTVALFIASFFSTAPTKMSWTVIILSFSAFLYLIGVMRRDNLRNGLLSGIFSFFGLVYISLSLATLVWIRSEADGVFWIGILFATVWGGDSVAMYTGKAFGRHKLAPRISPNKTWEGSIGSIVGSLIACLLVFEFMPSRPANILVFFLVVIILNIAAQLGDLVESLIKRSADLKDSGSLLPGHGGILDRIDALLFAAPVLWYYLAIVRR